MFSTDQLIAHAVGDYILQSDWMATEKTKRDAAAIVHVILYSLPFLFLTQSVAALIFIAATHFLIDRWRLARFVIWAKNWLAPAKWCGGFECNDNDDDGDVHEPHRVPRNPSWSQCQATGFDPNRPVWLRTWLMVITDNLMHVILNGVAIRYL